MIELGKHPYHQPEVSVIMPIYLQNDRQTALTRDAILSIQASLKNLKREAEIILVDDASPLQAAAEEVKQLLSPHDKVIHHLTNLGVAASWNSGKALSRGEYVAIVNNDIRVPPGWVETMIKGFKRGAKVAITGPLVGGPLVEPAVWEWDASESPVSRDYVWFPGYCFMLKRTRFFEDFDERFTPANCEDTDYWERALRAGWRLLKVPVAIFHAEGATVKEINKSRAANLYAQANQKFKEKWGFDPVSKFYP